MQGHKNWVLCLAWSPDGVILASGGMDGSVWLWNPASGQPLGSCRGEASRRAASRMSAALAGAHNKMRCRAHQVDHFLGVGAGTPGSAQPQILQRVERRQHQGECQAVERSHLVEASRPWHVRQSRSQVWDASSRRCLFSMASHSKAVSCVRWSGEGHIISCARDCSINVWSSEVSTATHRLLAAS